MGDGAEAAERLAWWREARFGLFIHWGLYALPAGVWQGREVPGIGEWIMHRARIPAVEYEQLARDFNPVRFDARRWVAMARDAGMRYIVITSKHHDGFAMFRSAASAYNIVDATPFGRDPLQELAEACREAGLRLCFYYSQAQDWHHPDAAGNDWDFPEEARKDFAHYLREKAVPQVRELLTQYGPVGLIWFDTPRTITAEQSEALAALVHELQPGCLVNSRVGHGAGDYESAGDNVIPVHVRGVPWETPATLNDTWGFKTHDQHWKSPRTLIRLLCDIVGKGGNYLLNVGPTAAGEIPEPSVERLRHVGAWMRRNGESIHGAGPSPFPAELAWGAITARPGRLYLHVFDGPPGPLVLRGLRCRVRGAHLLADPDRRPLDVAVHEHPDLDLSEVQITLPAQALDPDVTVVALEIDGEPQADPRPVQDAGGSIALEACQAQLDPERPLDAVGLVAAWSGQGVRATWNCAVVEPGAFAVELWTAAPRRTAWQAGRGVRISAAGQEWHATLALDERRPSARSPHQSFVVTRCGRLVVPHAGRWTVTLAAEPGSEEGDAPLLRGLRLVPAGPGA